MDERCLGIFRKQHTNFVYTCTYVYIYLYKRLHCARKVCKQNFRNRRYFKVNKLIYCRTKTKIKEEMRREVNEKEISKKIKKFLQF